MGKNLVQQARGKGGPSHKAPSFRFRGKASVYVKKEAKVLDLIRCQAHSAPLAVVNYEDDVIGCMIAPHGVKVGDDLKIGRGSPAKNGNTLPLAEIPEGASVFNIEGRPGDGGKFARGSGMTAKIVSKTETNIRIKLPSKKTKNFNPKCRATIGMAAGSARTDKPFLKAGKKHFHMKKKNRYWPIVSGSAQNAVDHPFGNKRTSRKSKAKPVSRHAPPGRKVGMLAAKRTGRKRGKQ